LPTRVIKKVQEEVRATVRVTVIATGEPPELENVLPDREKLAETPHFEFYAFDDYFPVQVNEFKEQAEEVFSYVSTRLGASVEQKIALSFTEPSKYSSPCPPRGFASFEPEPQIFMVVKEDASQKELLAILAHEISHIIHWCGLRGNTPSFDILTEGLADWGAGRYMSEWYGMPSFDVGVRAYVEQGEYLPLHQHYDLSNLYPNTLESGEECEAKREMVRILRIELISFVGFLIERYGMTKLLDLLDTSLLEFTETETIIKPPDYQAVYGSELNQLEATWLARIVCGE